MTDPATLITTASLIVAFLGGAIMLFAPCCITLMLPAYLGTVFKSRSKVVFMTLIFALGVATIILPIVLGARFITSFFSAYHPYIFAVGSLVMIAVGIMTLYGKKLPMPFMSRLPSPQVTNVGSAYSLGVISGVSSACCAPVLLGALSLAAISPSMLQAGAVGLAYTFGMVFPLFVLGIFYKRALWRRSQKLQQKRIRFANMDVPLSNFLSFVIFTLTGVIFLVSAILNRNQSSEVSATFSIRMKEWADTVAAPIQAVPYGEVIFGLALLALLALFVRLARRELKDPEDPEELGNKSDVR